MKHRLLICACAFLLIARPVAAGLQIKGWVYGTMPVPQNLPVPVNLEMDGDASGPEFIVVTGEQGLCNVGLVHITTGMVDWIQFLDVTIKPDRVYYVDVDNDGLLDAVMQMDSWIAAVGWSNEVGVPEQPWGGTLKSSVAAVPNPSSDGCTLAFSVSHAGSVSVTIFDPAGRRVRDVLSGQLPAGFYSPTWDGFDETGNRVSSGVYFARIVSPEGERSVKIVLAR